MEALGMTAPSPSYNHSAHTVSITVDLKEIFGTDIQRDLGERLGTAFVDRIVKSAEGGKSPKGHALKKYDDDYVASDEFKAAGKSKNKVNMTLYGDMLAQMEVLNFSDSKVTIGWQDSTQNAKAYAHMTGYRGHPTIKNGTKREFFFVSQKMIDEVKEEFAGEVEERSNSESNVAETLTALGIFQTVRDQEESQSDQLLIDLFSGGVDV